MTRSGLHIPQDLFKPGIVAQRQHWSGHGLAYILTVLFDLLYLRCQGSQFI